MPIYTYLCQECKSTDDYLVARWGEKPDSCIRCTSPNLERTFEGQTFACAKGSARITESGDISQGQGVSNVEVKAQTQTGLQPGLHITEGITRDKKRCINISRVQPNGKVDASVTGYKK